ncbi:hypothetical protein F3Y22_tig00110847pilonHSYRG00188 [Hibiscus syriacus]|uniref:Methyltransferase type 11 domain-containing protein n=1 Tax=Hibiscus syriacus TaxID=106335 RepID=A0A6A2ZKS8_HIBSY|nr:uncharacterized protein LOC120143409 [Hibiscus syriacus]KAE8692280.1 hypothetical protein F3Y22_tig00110847pilonHSYRG00188 [Hibiscus syriacus]
MGKSNSSRDWAHIYAIYGMNQWQTLVFLLCRAVFFSLFSFVFLFYFHPIFHFFQTSISAVCLFLAAVNFFYSAGPLHYEMAQRIVGSVYDWSTVKLALDVGCGRGILLKSVATQLKKTGSSGRVVGLDRSKRTTLSMLQTANIEGVGEYVTCKEGDVRSLPFQNNYFDVVLSAVFVHTVGKEYGQRTVEAATERVRVLGEMVRVLKPGGVGVDWDLLHVPEYVRRLQELKIEDIRVSESVTAFMVSSHMVSFRKPNQHIVGPGDVRLDWQC